MDIFGNYNSKLMINHYINPVKPDNQFQYENKKIYSMKKNDVYQKIADNIKKVMYNNSLSKEILSTKISNSITTKTSISKNKKVVIDDNHFINNFNKNDMRNIIDENTNYNQANLKSKNKSKISINKLPNLTNSINKNALINEITQNGSNKTVLNNSKYLNKNNQISRNFPNLNYKDNLPTEWEKSKFTDKCNDNSSFLKSKESLFNTKLQFQNNKLISQNELFNESLKHPIILKPLTKEKFKKNMNTQSYFKIVKDNDKYNDNDNSNEVMMTNFTSNLNTLNTIHKTDEINNLDFKTKAFSNTERNKKSNLMFKTLTSNNLIKNSSTKLIYERIEKEEINSLKDINKKLSQTDIYVQKKKVFIKAFKDFNKELNDHKLKFPTFNVESVDDVFDWVKYHHYDYLININPFFKMENNDLKEELSSESFKEECISKCKLTSEEIKKIKLKIKKAYGYCPKEEKIEKSYNRHIKGFLAKLNNDFKIRTCISNTNKNDKLIKNLCVTLIHPNNVKKEADKEMIYNNNSMKNKYLEILDKIEFKVKDSVNIKDIFHLCFDKKDLETIKNDTEFYLPKNLGLLNSEITKDITLFEKIKLEEEKTYLEKINPLKFDLHISYLENHLNCTTKNKEIRDKIQSENNKKLLLIANIKSQRRKFLGINSKLGNISWKLKRIFFSEKRFNKNYMNSLISTKEIDFEYIDQLKRLNLDKAEYYNDENDLKELIKKTKKDFRNEIIKQIKVLRLNVFKKKRFLQMRDKLFKKLGKKHKFLS